MLIVWLILIILIILSAFFLALKSVANYLEKPKLFQEEYAAYLVKNAVGLNTEVIEQLFQKTLPKRLIVALEWLFKGQKQALVIYGPKAILTTFNSLGLLELEDYSLKFSPKSGGLFFIPVEPAQTKINLPDLEEHEEVWFQLCLQPKGPGFWEAAYLPLQRLFSTSYRLSSRRQAKLAGLESPKAGVFYSVLKVAILAGSKRVELIQKGLPRPLPSKQSIEQKIRIYQERSLPLSLGVNKLLSPSEILRLLQNP